MESDHFATKQENCLQVLRYWHQLEFFTPYNLNEALSRGDHPLDFSLQALQDGSANQLLPWLNNKDTFRYIVYLLPFDKNELTRLSQQFFPVEFKQQNPIELEEKLDDEGLTCFARLLVDQHGVPQWQGLSISTLPWAMGMMQSGEFGHLNEEIYHRDIKLLKSALHVLENEFNKTKSPDLPHGYLNTNLLVNLLRALCKWARFVPDYPFVIKVKTIQKTAEQISATSIKALPSNLPIDPNAIEQQLTSEDEPLDILNSFYIHDLEKTINHLKHQPHAVLESYIEGYPHRKDVLAVDYQPLLIQQLHPANMPLGRWPQHAKHRMSLMQQLCINQCFSANDAPILATNGPPGTGKTTLLKDIIAENIVQRATVLSDFNKVKDCFTVTKKLAMDEKEITLHGLNPRLSGFEMVVVSSNNTAVENISRELPLKNNLAEMYQESCQYLRPVAAKLMANHYNHRVHPAPPNAQPWGLLAVALGNSANRQEFIERFFFSPDNNSQASSRIQQGQYLNIWEWRAHYKGCSFAEAKMLFKQSLQAVDTHRNKLQQFADLSSQLLADPWAEKIHHYQENIITLNQKLASLSQEKDRAQTALQQVIADKELLFQQLEQQRYLQPSLWKRMLNTQEAKQFKQLQANLQHSYLTLTEELLQLQQKIAEQNRQIAVKQEDLDNTSGLIKQVAHQQQQAISQFNQLQLYFPDINLPKDNITSQDQIDSFWQTKELNALRSQLFIHALKLHEAWLAEALQQKYFGGNLLAINTLLTGKSPLASADELAIWQSLFMVIPVISSTFASVAKQFKNLGPQTIGWLLIDEAGQAIPQAAIGALWRCKKAVVVGDPRQIEPIMTLPPHLIEGIAKHHFLANFNTYWMPHTTSIQKLADLASPLGSLFEQNHQSEWVGIPLLVHRRCLEPMFSIANKIAYDNKMINARANTILNFPDSAWFDVEGKAIDKQYVPEQLTTALKLFIWFFNHDKKLPDLFIITPFRVIKKYIKELLHNQDNWVSELDPTLAIPTKQELRQWLYKHVGTVHTFQGKEADKVIFILGADNNQKGAINWACSKPNLLNVALTRARNRVYIIGDWNLWANKRYFCEASAKLQRKKTENTRESVAI